MFCLSFDSGETSTVAVQPTCVSHSAWELYHRQSLQPNLHDHHLITNIKYVNCAYIVTERRPSLSQYQDSRQNINQSWFFILF
ncbi:hypothetical protein AYI69_g8250 [Smittium culicis]|uniref:Uncharacterized protein n=1 Tax=Smittium culicis TaxID=133412 RepID=A0A1R1XKY0_9FUNG|nr:hypothetical protein AYI69_g8250 [Smittium culicis]